MENNKRLLGLLALKAIANHILTIPDKEWNMNTWYRQWDADNCGTVGCAIGHSIDLPEVKATGLKLELSSEVFYPYTGEPQENFAKYSDYNAFQVVADALAIDKDLCSELFDAAFYMPLTPTQKIVSDRILKAIDELINGNR